MSEEEPGGGFLPTQLPGLQLWLRADKGITLGVGLGVAAWADQSTTGDANKNVTQGTAAQQPTLLSVDPLYNNQPTLTFVSASAQKLVSGSWAAALALPETIFMVSNLITTATNQYFSDGIVANTRGVNNDVAADECAIYNGAFLASGVGQSTAVRARAGYFDTAAASKVWVSRLTANATGNAGTSVATRTGLTVGNTPAAAALNGKIAEVIIYSGALSAPNFAKVMNYLGSRYGITIGA